MCVSFPELNQNPTEPDIPDDYNSIPGCLKQIFSKYHFDKFEIDFVILVYKLQAKSRIIISGLNSLKCKRYYRGILYKPDYIS